MNLLEKPPYYPCTKFKSTRCEEVYWEKPKVPHRLKIVPSQTLAVLIRPLMIPTLLGLPGFLPSPLSTSSVLLLLHSYFASLSLSLNQTSVAFSPSILLFYASLIIWVRDHHLFLNLMLMGSCVYGSTRIQQ